MVSERRQTEEATRCHILLDDILQKVKKQKGTGKGTAKGTEIRLVVARGWRGGRG
jgi:hypothetical protein